MNKKKNVLAYISLVCFITICAILGFVIGTQHNTPEEEGIKKSNNKDVMTKTELSNYISKFVENIGTEFDKVSDISNEDLFWFSAKVYLKENNVKADDTGAYALPQKELASIIDRYFGIKGYKYEVKENDTIKYDKKSNSYTAVIKDESNSTIVVEDTATTNDTTVATVKVTNSEGTQNYTCVINKNNKIITFKKTTGTTYEKINYEIIDEKALKVNATAVLFKDCSETMSIHNVEQLSDVLVVDAGCGADVFLSIVDKNGNQIVKFTPEYLKNYSGAQYDKNIALYTKAIYSNIGNYRIDGNDIYIKTNNLGQSPDHICSEYKKNQNFVAIYEEKFSYLGNGKFSNPVIEKTVLAKDFINQNNIDCSK